MSLFKSKIIPIWKRVKNTCLSFCFIKKNRKLSDQMELDKKLVYSLSPKKIPDGKQLKHLRKFLKPKEILFIRIALFIFVISLGFLSYSFISKRINYLPDYGGTYSEALVGYPKNINPLYASSREVDNDLSRLIYSSLFRYNNDGVLENDLVEFFEIKGEGKEYLVKIKENVKWHEDNGYLNTDDVVFTFNLIKDESYRSPLRQSFVGIEIEKVDDSFVKFILPEAYSPFVNFLTFGIMPKNLWENVNSESIILSELNLMPIGSGPFKFKSILKTKSGDIKEYFLEANKDYYQGEPYLKTLKFVFYPDHQEALKALNDKQVLGLSLPYSQKGNLLAKNSLYIRDLIQPQIISLFFNDKNNNSLANKDLRLSLEKAINKQEIVQDIFSDSYQVAAGPFLRNSSAFNSELASIEFLPDEARTFFSGKEIKLELTVVDTGSNLMVAEKIKSYWQEIGVNVELKIVSGEQTMDILKNRNFQVLLYGQAIGGDPDIYSFWHSSQVDSGLNLAGYKNDEVDKLLTEARTEINNNQRMEKYRKIHELILGDVSVIFLYSPSYLYVQSKDLRGFTGQTLINTSDRFNNISSWYIRTNKEINW